MLVVWKKRPFQPGSLSITLSPFVFKNGISCSSPVPPSGRQSVCHTPLALMPRHERRGGLDSSSGAEMNLGAAKPVFFEHYGFWRVTIHPITFSESCRACRSNSCTKRRWHIRIGLRPRVRAQGFIEWASREVVREVGEDRDGDTEDHFQRLRL